jgi:hypothetical protein
VVLHGGGEVGGDELLLLLGEKVLPVSRLVLLFPFLLRPGISTGPFHTHINSELEKQDGSFHKNLLIQNSSTCFPLGPVGL